MAAAQDDALHILAYEHLLDAAELLVAREEEILLMQEEEREERVPRQGEEGEERPPSPVRALLINKHKRAVPANYLRGARGSARHTVLWSPRFGGSAKPRALRPVHTEHLDARCVEWTC